MYDLIVLGGGPGGYVAAIKAGRAGLKTALIEKNRLGGTCLNKGCIPTKYLLHTAEVFGSFAENDLGLSGENLKYNINAIYEKKNAVVDKLVGGIEKLIENAGVDFYNGEGKITSKSSVSVNGKELEFKNLIIATGSSVFAPPIAGIETAMTSDDILGKEPVDFKSVIIIGGGVIGIEFATVYANLGKEVTIVELEKTILPPFDRDIAMQQALVLKKRGVKIINGAMVTKIEKTGCTFTLKEKEESITADAVIVCIGRIAEIKDIGLDSAGIEYDKRGIITDACMKTNVEGIYAIGDAVKGNVMLAHNAENQGHLVVENIVNNTKHEKQDIIPSCVYSTPEIAGVGLSEKEAEAKGITVKIGKVPMGSNGKSVLSGLDVGFIKVLFNEEDRIVGCQMMCDSATDMIGAIGTLVTNKAKRENILKSMYPHPTVVEAFYEAVEDVEKSATHMIYKK